MLYLSSITRIHKNRLRTFISFSIVLIGISISRAMVGE